MKTKYYRKNEKYKGFIYLYSYFLDQYKDETGFILINIFKKMARTKVISFSISPEKSLIKIESNKTSPFPHCKTGFDHKYLRIFICYIPIFNYGKLITTRISELTIGYILKEDFLIENVSLRSKIIINDGFYLNLLNSVYFEGIHYMRPDLFVQSMLSLTPMNEETYDEINEIKRKIDANFENVSYDEFQDKWKPSIFDNYKKIIVKITSAYTYIMRTYANILNFSIRQTQIYAVLESYKTFFPDKNDKTAQLNNNNGVVYQIKTGEGKSCIVSLIAAMLAFKGINVHIVSSNIKLCNRDYQESLEFFRKLDMESAVLLHQNELPYYNEDLIIDDSDEMMINYYNKFYFNNDQFENPSRMNFSVCGIKNDGGTCKGAKIVFSTFVNFECFYMYLMENFPNYIDKYIRKCGLLIDEVDSILIDEIKNGTIIAKEMRSDAKQILPLICRLKKNGKSEKETLDILKKRPLCKDMLLNDVKQIYKEIDKVNEESFCAGSFYSIEKLEIKNSNRIKNFINKIPKTIVNKVKEGISKLKNENEKEEDYIEEEEEENFENYIDDNINNNDDDEDSDELKIDESNTNKTVEFHYIIPFDKDNKGIIEPNKEFSGFIPQLIALKESIRDPSIIFKDISISYLYVSHPIYASLYHKICGFTGTVGKLRDKAIFKNQYKLLTRKVPRFKPNLRVDFPVTACDSIMERNTVISNEVLLFHEKNNPVLVIFQDFNEIYEVLDVINFKYKGKNRLLINIFDGKNDLIKPDFIGGVKGSITLGTNICCRGTDIKCSSEYPLHVIVSYFTENSRIMNQAFGRTARNGQVGSCHCICLKGQLYKKSMLNPMKIENALQKDAIKSEKQLQYVENLKNNHPWIFRYIEKNENFQVKKIRELRKTRINVNRIVAYRYRYPICMSYRTFIRIQVQKIFSLFNCPNCVYTWRLFQQYVRELILESWTLMIRRFDLQYSNTEKISEYEKKLDKRIENLNNKIEKYLPSSMDNFIDIFDHICNKVIRRYNHKILKSMGYVIESKSIKFGQFSKLYKAFEKIGSTYFQIGFKPYSLLSKSGARIAYSNTGDMNYIQDPELSYMKKLPHNKFSFISITERIDEFLNFILATVNSKLSEKLFLKFFVRRTLVGCEFGVCLDLLLENKALNNNPFILIDKDPLLLFTIFVRSIIPLLGGILLIVLIYLVQLGKKIAKFVACPQAEIIKKTKDFLIKQARKLSIKVADSIYGKMVDFLNDVFEKQLLKIETYDKTFAKVLRILKKLLDTIGYDNNKGAKSINKLTESIQVSPNFAEFIKDCQLGPKAIEVGVLLILCLVTFIRNFSHSLAIMFKNMFSSDAKEFDSTFDKNENDNDVDNYSLEAKEMRNKKIEELEEKRENDVIDKMEKVNEIEEVNFDEIFEKLIKTKYFEFYKTKLENEEKKIIVKNELDYEYTFSEVGQISKNNPNYVIHLPSNKQCYQVYFNPHKERCWSAISTYTKLKHPVITPYVGFVLDLNQSFMMFDTKTSNSVVYNFNEVLDKITNNIININITQKLVIFYGIACGMEFLHDNEIFYHNFTPENIFLVNNYFPLILGFESFKNKKDKRFVEFDDDDSEEINVENDDDDDEFDVKDNVDVNVMKKSNVYSYGKIFDLLINADKHIFFNQKIDSFNKELVKNCCISDQQKRFTFSDICNNFEDTFNNIDITEYEDYILRLKNKRTNH